MALRRSYLVSIASAMVVAVALAGPAPLMAQTTYPFITGDAEDPHFNQPYVDVEEWRDAPADVPSPLGDTAQRQGAAPIKVRHLYVHGGFKGTDTRFTFHFPSKELYKGRFYQATHQLLTNENSTPYNVAMTLAAGAYLVQSNMGGSEIARSAQDNASGRTDASIGNYRANAADLSAWVEKGVAPPVSTRFTVKDGQVHVPPNAAARKGIQPVVELKVNGGVRVVVR